MRSPVDPPRIVEVDEDLMALMPSQSCSCPELLIGPDGWRGDHDVCCDGRGLMAREAIPSVWTTLLAKLAPVIWSVVVTLPWLYVHSDDEAGEREVLFHLVYMPVLTVVSIVVLFVLIVWREPGFCLRNPHPTENHPRNTCKDVYVNGHRIWRKWYQSNKDARQTDRQTDRQADTMRKHTNTRTQQRTHPHTTEYGGELVNRAN